MQGGGGPAGPPPAFGQNAPAPSFGPGPGGPMQGSADPFLAGPSKGGPLPFQSAQQPQPSMP